MEIVLAILCVIVLFEFFYIKMLNRQLKQIDHQLKVRLKENSRRPVSIQLMGRELERVVANINKCLKAEENLRLKCVREENKYRELIANISHDLRTPLTSVKGYQQIMEKGEMPDEQRTRLVTAMKHTDELGQLIEQFFEYSYLMNAEPEMTLEKVNLTNLVADCFMAFVVQLEERGLTVEFDGDTPYFVLADKEMMRRIVQNLIRNMIQHAYGMVEAELKSGKGVVWLVFRNEVKAPDEIDVERLFERFYTGDKARSSSTGLGLSIVKLLVEKMDGNVGAKLEGKYIEIQISIPVFY